VAGLEHTAFAVRAPEMSDGGDIHDVRIGWINHDAADVTRLDETGGMPRVPGIGRHVDAVAPRGALTVVGLAGARPDEGRVRRRNGDGADRHHRIHAIEEWVPRRALVGALEDAAAGSGDVDGVWLAGDARDREVVDAAARGRRADAAPAQIAESRRIEAAALRVNPLARAGGNQEEGN